LNILGLNFDHDGSAAIVKDGKLVVAIGSERILRIKKFTGLTDQVINYVLKEAELSIDDIDLITLSDYYLESSNGVLNLFYENSQIGSSQITSTRQMIYGNTYVNATAQIFNRTIPAVIVSHHTSHASAAYYTSNSNNSLCFSMDSSYGGIPFNSLIAHGDNNNLTVLEYPGLMIGVGYAIFTEQLGLGPALYKAGSTMGLASYGTPNEDVTKNLQKYIKESYFNIDSKEEDYVKYYFDLWEKWSGSKNRLYKKDSFSLKARNIAASIQYLFENCLLDAINKNSTKNVDSLCLSGGSLLNCNANSFIKKNTNFKNIHHFPACGDDGIAVGSALYAAHNIYNEPRHKYSIKELSYLGKTYEVKEPDYNFIANAIADGKIIAWFMGKSEFGPRALGARSILADPRNFHNREIINFSVKNREWFRPIAPVVLEEESSKWFDFNGKSPYMLYTANVLQKEKIPAVTHVDGTARMQTINEETNEYYYRLIKEFFNITNVPLLINTSLNADGPILETEEDALLFFKNNKEIDILVLNGEIHLR
jgi:carbamoyltransferase